MEIINEVRKEDDYYFQGPFWIKADLYKDLLLGKFELVCDKLLCDFNGDYKDASRRKDRTHQEYWKTLNNDLPYNYYPRDRVGIYDGTAYINIVDKANKPKIIQAIINEYNINKLEIIVSAESSDHYNFLLK